MTAPDKTAPAARSGVEPQPGPFVAHGVSRDPEIQFDELTIPSAQIREFAALVFVGLFFAVVLVALLLLRLIPFGELFR